MAVGIFLLQIEELYMQRNIGYAEMLASHSVEIGALVIDGRVPGLECCC